MLSQERDTPPHNVPSAFDLVIRGGRVVDGTGSPAYRADVGIRRGRIVAIGRHIGSARLQLDAGGCIVAPGFIDVHTHGEEIARLPLAENFTRQGVTSIVAGNCGFSKPDLGAFFRSLQKQGIAPNFGSLIGHSTVRLEGMGGAFNRPPEPDEMERMKRHVARAMRAGALGLSTGLIYQPGSFATTDEIIELAKVAGQYDGIYTSHMRSEGNAIADAIAELFRIAREGGIRAQVSHIKLSGQNNWGRAREILGLIEAARAEGLDITQDQYLYTAYSTILFDVLPPWSLEGGQDSFRQRLADPDQRQRIAEDMRQSLLRRNQNSYEWVTIAGCPNDPELNGKTIPEAARLRKGTDDLDAQIDMLLELNAAGPVEGVFHSMSEDDLQVFLKHPNTMLGSDSGVREYGKAMPHPRGYGNHVRVLSRYVREKGLLRLEEAVRRMTSLPATVFRLRDRGMIRLGAFADIVVFDPERVADTATFDNPHQYPTGLPHVIVNGEPIVRDSAVTGSRPGKILRSRPGMAG